MTRCRTTRRQNLRRAGLPLRSILGGASLLLANLLVQLAAAPPVDAPRPGAGALLLAGGGHLTDNVFQRFLELAGGSDRARLIVIPTASDAADEPDAGQRADEWRARGFRDVTLLHTRSPIHADEVEFAAPLSQATAVWLEGGDQTRIAAAYLGTAVERELYALLARGGVVGGTSAGAAVQSRVMIEGGNPLARLGAGFDLLPGTIVDQHFLRRNRVERLLGALDRRPELTGVGIDEGTALVVAGERYQVLGDSYVVVCRHDPETGRVRLEVLSPGDEGPAAALRASP